MRITPRRRDKARIAREILAYLTDHPDAGDTLEGIMEWWMLERKIKFESSSVEQALNELVTKGDVLRVKGKNSKVYFNLNKKITK